MDLEDIAKLTSAQGRYLLDSLPEYAPELAIKLGDGLRQRGIDPKLAAAALTQSRLRQRARAKFGQFADQMLFTDEALQQATRLEVAAHHAQRYQEAGMDRLTDLTGGIGGDALAMAALGLRVTVYERDPARAAVAQFNLAAFPEAKVINEDFRTSTQNLRGALFADPSRRNTDGKRQFDPNGYDPPLPLLLELARDHPMGIKVAPGLPHRHIPAQAEAQWVSVDGSLVEAGLWFGALRSPGIDPTGSGPHRTALALRHGRAHHLAANPACPTSVPTSQPTALAASAPAGRLSTGPLNDYIYEPDDAVIRASLIAEAAAGLGSANLVSPRIAYVTSSARVTESPFLTGYQVQDSFPFSLKRLKSYLREHGIGQVTVKKRGTAVDPHDLRRRLNLKGNEPAVVILTRLGAQQSVVIAQALPKPKESP